MQDKQRNGSRWPKDPLEKHILKHLQSKAVHGYQWPEWAVAEEAAKAAYDYFEHAWQKPTL